MKIPTEPIGSIPRPLALIEAIAKRGSDDPALEPLYEQAIRDMVARFEGAGSPVITEGRLAMKVDPSGQLHSSFIDLNNLALSRFSPEDRARIGVHTCPGGDCDSTHSADVDYAELLPSLKSGTGYSKRPNTFRPSSWAPPTTAASRRSATIRLRPGTPPLKKSRHVSSAPRSRTS